MFKIALIILQIFILKYKKKLKLCICTLGKSENRYIREFVEYYKKYGVDKIFLYDNNDINGERFEEVISDYIKKGFVEIIDYRGIPFALTKIMDNCYQKNYDKFDWLIFYEIDEFIYLKNFYNIKLFLNQKIFNNCKKIQLNWVHRSDNNLIYYENKSVVERFKERGINVKKNKFNRLAYIKSMIRGHMNNITITNNHLLENKINGCNGFGNEIKLKFILNLKPDYEYYYINHYYGKSLEEFVQKLKRGDIQLGITKKNNLYQIKKYFYINKLTNEKLDYIERELKLNLSEFRKKLKKK